MKDLFGGWRGYLKSPSVLEVIKEDLIREFNQADKEGLLADEADFSVSYEIELESRVPLEGEDSWEEPEYELDRRAMRQFIDDNIDFDSEVGENRVLDNFLFEWMDIRDLDDMLETYFNHRHGRDPSEAERQAMLFGLAMDYEESVKEKYEQFINAISSVGDTTKRQRGAKMQWAEKTGKFLNKVFGYEHNPAQQDLFPDADMRGQHMLDWIRKNVFDPDDPGEAMQRRGTAGIATLFQEVFSGFYTLMELEDEAGHFYDDFAYVRGRWTNANQADTVGTPSDVFRYKFSMRLETIVHNKIEELARELYEEAFSDPEDYLSGIFARHELEARFLIQPDPEETQQDYMDLLREHLPNFMARYEDVLKFEDDMSLENGIEFSMDDPPYLTGLNAAIEFLKIFFDDFNNQTNWVMSDRTGLHTNVGYLPVDQHEDRDLFKGMLFLNDDMAKRGFEKRKNSRWAMDIKRDALDMVSKGFGDAKVHIGEIVKDENRMQQLKRRLSDSVESSVMGKYTKSLGMNITHLERYDYVEFRYPGQDEPTYANMVNATLYYAHLMKAISDEDYKKKEYITKLVGFFNNLRAKDLETDRQDLKTARKFFSLPLGTQFVYVPDSNTGSPSASDGLKAWIKVFYENELKPQLLKKQGADGMVRIDDLEVPIDQAYGKLERLISRQLGYGTRIPIIYHGLKKKPNRPDLKGKDKYLIMWIFPREQRSGKPDFRVANQTIAIFVRNLNKFHLSDPEYAIKKSGLDVDLSDPIELSEMGSIALHAIGDANWRQRANKEKEGDELDELKFTFTSMNDPVYVKFLRWYKEQYRKWTRGDLEYMISGDE
jgi:hypothetical protein